MLLFFFLQLSKHNAELAELLKQEEFDDDDADDNSTTVNDPALHYYSKHTAQIEVFLSVFIEEKFVDFTTLKTSLIATWAMLQAMIL